MGEHRRERRPNLAAEDLAKEIALEAILGPDTTHTVRELSAMPEVAYSVTFEQVWRPIKTALLAAQRGVLDLPTVGESVPISERPN